MITEFQVTITITYMAEFVRNISDGNKYGVGL
jgi:hypothetical protein